MLINQEMFYFFFLSTTPNKHTLRRIADIGCGWFEFFDNNVKSKWQKKVLLVFWV